MCTVLHIYWKVCFKCDNLSCSESVPCHCVGPKEKFNSTDKPGMHCPMVAARWEGGESQFSLSHKSRWQRAQRGKVSVQDSVGLHFKYKPKEYQHKKDTTLQMALKVVTGWYPPTGNPCPVGVPNDWHSGGTYEDTLSNKAFNWFPRESISTKPLLYQLVNSGTPAQVR